MFNPDLEGIFSTQMPLSSLDHDWQIRLAAFHALRHLTERSGGIVTREEMTAGFQFEGERVPFALRPRGIWKPARLGADGAALSFTTTPPVAGVDPPYDDQVGSDREWLEYRYQGVNPEAADNRAMRRAYELGRPLIYFYGVRPGRFEAVFPVYVVGDDPAALTFQVAADATGVGDPRLMHGGAEAPLKAYATTVVKRRLHQRRFRELVVAAYGERCTVCRLHHTELLDAAHILEDRDVRGLPEVPNGLALCGVHHGAYDANIMGIAPDCSIHIRRDILEEIDGPMLRHGLQEMHGKLIVVPRTTELRPKREYLDERFERFRAA